MQYKSKKTLLFSYSKVFFVDSHLLVAIDLEVF